MYKVQKKDGALEDFDQNKITGGVQKAGGSPEDAEKVLAEVQVWLPSASVNGVVMAGDVRSKVLEVFKTLNPTAAAAYEAYQKPAEPAQPTPAQ